MKHIWACTCGEQTDVTEEQVKAGAVFKCPGCKQVYGCVRGMGGNKAWILIAPSSVKFHRLVEDDDAL